MVTLIPRRFGARVGGTGGAQYIPATLMEVVTQAGQVTNPTTAQKTFIEGPDQAEVRTATPLTSPVDTLRLGTSCENRTGYQNHSAHSCRPRTLEKEPGNPTSTSSWHLSEVATRRAIHPLQRHLLARRKWLYVNLSTDAPTCNAPVFRSVGKLGHRKTLSDRASSTFEVVT